MTIQISVDKNTALLEGGCVPAFDLIKGVLEIIGGTYLNS